MDALATYTIQEIAAPSGWSLDPTVQTVTVTDGSTCDDTQLLFTFIDHQITTIPPTTPTPTTTTCAPTPAPTTTTPVPTTTTCAPTPAPTTTRPPRTTLPPPPPPTCGIQITVNGERSYSGGGVEPLPSGTYEIDDSNGNQLVGPFIMNSGTICQNVPLGSYSIIEVAPPSTSHWVPETSFPIRGECVTASACPQTGAQQTILYRETQ